MISITLLVTRPYAHRVHRVSVLALIGFGLLALIAPAAQSHTMLDHPEVRRFIAMMVKEHRFDAVQLNAWFSAIRRRDDIIRRITRPAEKTRPWYAYREIFLDPPRIRNGVDFWRRHRTTLHTAERRYGVPAEIITAIIGVETRYGVITGKDGVLEALSTLAFHYPRRARFFRSELEHYLLLSREEGIDPLSLRGSYAGAMGIAQFMPSSYRNFAVDFDNDGRRDLWHNPIDAIGSVGNYLAAHHWQPGEPIALRARVEGKQYRKLLSKDLKPQLTLEQMRRSGVSPATPQARTGQRAILLALEERQGTGYWLGFDNFYVITRYNRSPLYALAVVQLSREIHRQYHRQPQ